MQINPATRRDRDGDPSQISPTQAVLPIFSRTLLSGYKRYIPTSRVRTNLPFDQHNRPMYAKSRTYACVCACVRSLVCAFSRSKVTCLDFEKQVLDRQNRIFRYVTLTHLVVISKIIEMELTARFVPPKFLGFKAAREGSLASVCVCVCGKSRDFGPIFSIAFPKTTKRCAMLPSATLSPSHRGVRKR